MTDKEPDNMRIWNLVCETNRADTKDVSYGARKFTAIDAQKQIKRATELWGPIGGWWGISDQKIVVVDGIVIYTASLFFPKVEVAGSAVEDTPDPVTFCTLPIASDHVFKPNEDSVKKVRTDALTKGLSWIGFNSDVFEGKFDDSKYTGAQPPQQQQEPPRDRHPAKQPEPGSAVTQKSTFPCPSGCGGTMKSRTGSKGWFFGCSNYPNCRQTVDRHGADQYVNAADWPPQTKPMTQAEAEDLGLDNPDSIPF